jgi:integrase/recombinase XerD
MKTINETDIGNFKQHLLAKGRQPATVESYARDCETFLEFIDEVGLSHGDISGRTLTEFQNSLINKGIRPNSLRRTVIGVRQFYRYLQDANSWDKSPLDESVIPDRQDVQALNLESSTFELLVSKVNSETSYLKCCRDLCLIYLLGYEGVKVTELIELEWRDFLYASDGGRLRISGPRGRTIHLELVSTSALREYRNQMRQALGSGVSFNSSSKIMVSFKGLEGKHWTPHLTRHGVKFALYELGTAVGSEKLNSEDLRHFAIAHKVELGMTPEMIMNHFGLRTLGNIGKHLNNENGKGGI